jgi:hypothetical protein
MDQKIKDLSSTTFCGRRFRRQQIADIQATVKTFSNLSRCELALTICEHLNWVTPRGTNKINTCLNALEEMEALGIIVLPPKIEQKKKRQQDIPWTDQTNEPTHIDCTLDELLPISLQVVTDKEQTKQWNEFVDRYHYLSYKRPIGSHLRYYVIDRNGRKLGCLLFSFATWSLSCRDKWIGWSNEQREKHLNLVINNNRFLIFPWVKVKHLASKTLSLVINQIADDWETHHGFRPVLLETFVDPTKYKGSCYKAANWQCIGKTTGKTSSIKSEPHNQKEVYIYPLIPDARLALVNSNKSPSKKAQPMKITNFASDEHINLWQKIINIVAATADNFDQQWQKRKRVISTLLIVLFIFRLVFSKNKQGYGVTIAELWDHCHKMNIPLPQSKPVAASAFCMARTKLDENIFKILNAEIIRTYQTDRDDHQWKQHRIYAVDGSKLNLPRQLMAYSYETPSAKSYYPQGLMSCLYRLKSKIPMDFELVSHNNERTVALNHLNVLKKDDVVVYDRGYFSYFMLYSHYKRGIHAIFRLKNGAHAMIDEFITSMDTDRTIMIVPSLERQKKIRKEHPEIDFMPISLRLIKYRVSETTYIIGSTLIDPQQYKIEDFSDVYHSRWGIEELYKVSKVLIDVEDFHSQSERGIKQELFAHFVIITLSRIFANQTDDALLLGKKTGRIAKELKTNIKNCLVTVARNLESLFLKQSIFIKETITTIINLVSTCRQKERVNRSYERRSNKIVKKWKPTTKEKNNIQTPAIVV